MLLIITSKVDEASENIFTQLQKLNHFEIVSKFEENPVYAFKNFIIVTINGQHLYSDNIDVGVRSAMNIDIEAVIFASKHRSESGQRTLTVHPLGNFSPAPKLGGYESKLVPSAPTLMTATLRLLKKNYISVFGNEKTYSVSFEATHHGPYLETPAFYIEIGSDESAWRDVVAGEIIAKTISELDSRTENYPVGIGVGGGHYAPRFTDVALERKISFGHIIPGYAFEHITEDMARQTIEKTKDVSMVYFHRKAMKKQEIRVLEEMFLKCGLRIVREENLEPLC